MCMQLARRGQTPQIASVQIRANVPHCALTRVPYPVRSVQPGVTSDRLYRARDANPEARSGGSRQFRTGPAHNPCRAYKFRARAQGRSPAKRSRAAPHQRPNKSRRISLTIRSATLRCPPRRKPPNNTDRSPASPAHTKDLY